MSARSTSATSPSRPSAAFWASRRFCRAAAAFAMASLRLLFSDLPLLLGPCTLAVDRAQRPPTGRSRSVISKAARLVTSVRWRRLKRISRTHRVAIDRYRLVDQPAADVLGEVFRPAVTILAIMRQRLGADGLERPRDRRLELACPGQVSRPDLAEDFTERRAGSRRLARQDLEQDGAQAVDVGPGIDQAVSARRPVRVPCRRACRPGPAS